MAVGATVSRKANGYASANAYQMYAEAYLTGNVSGLQRQVHVRAMGLATNPGGYELYSSPYAYTDYNSRQVNSWWPRGTWITLVETWVYVNGNQNVTFGVSYNSNNTTAWLPLNGSWYTNVTLWIPAVWSQPSMAANSYMPNVVAETQNIDYELNTTAFNPGTGADAKYVWVLRYLNPTSNIWVSDNMTSTGGTGTRYFEIPIGNAGRRLRTYSELYYVNSSGGGVWESYGIQDRTILPPASVTETVVDELAKNNARGTNYFSNFEISAKSEFDAFEKNGINIPISNLEQGGREYANGNTFVTTAFCRTINPIDVTPGETIGITTDFNLAADSGLLFYNDSTFISGTLGGGRVATVPAGANKCHININGTGTPSDVINLKLVGAGHNKVRYIRIFQKGSTSNTGNHLCQLEVYDRFGVNLALGKTLTTTPGYTVDNSANATKPSLDSTYAYISPEDGTRVYFQLDLGAEYDIKDVRVWRYYPDRRSYYETAVWGYDKDMNNTAIWHEYAWDGTYQEHFSRNSLPFRRKNFYGLKPDTEYTIVSKVRTQKSTNQSNEVKRTFLTHPETVQVINAKVKHITQTDCVLSMSSSDLDNTMTSSYSIWDETQTTQIISPQDNTPPEYSKSISGLSAGVTYWARFRLKTSRSEEWSNIVWVQFTTEDQNTEFTKVLKSDGTVTEYSPLIYIKDTNLININRDSYTSNGVTLTNNGDGTVTLNGTASSNGTIWFTKSDNTIVDNTDIIKVKEKERIRVSYEVVSGSTSFSNGVDFGFRYTSDDFTDNYVKAAGTTPVIKKIDDRGSIAGISIKFSNGNTFTNWTIKPKLTCSKIVPISAIKRID